MNINLTGKLSSPVLRGYSAYDLAVLDGFEGTEEEWLASLVGNGIDRITQNSDYTLTIHYTDGTSMTTTSIRGGVGERGPQGIQGERGLQGERGPQGIQGERGEKGETGERGPQGIQGIQGEKGEPGEQGIPGEKGEKGDKGDAGPQGIQGIQGEKGDKGDKGDTGEQGIQGPKGDTGEKGEQGEQGIQGLKGDKGDKGDDGEDGYTPVKGTDYWTEQEITEVTEQITDDILGSVVTSVNGQTGDITLETGDINYHICTNGEYDATTLAPTLVGNEKFVYLVPNPVVVIPTVIDSAMIDYAGIDQTISEDPTNGYTEWIYYNNKFEMVSPKLPDTGAHICDFSEYDEDTLIPTLQGKEGILYLVPNPTIAVPTAVGSAAVGVSGVRQTMKIDPINGFTEWIYCNNKFEMVTPRRPDAGAHICIAGEYNATTLIPTLNGQSGVIYLVPNPPVKVTTTAGSAIVGNACAGQTLTIDPTNGYTEWIYCDDKFEVISGQGGGSHVCDATEYNKDTLVPTLTGKSGVIYLVPRKAEMAETKIGSAIIGVSTIGGSTYVDPTNGYNEWIYNNNTFERIGESVATDNDVKSMLRQLGLLESVATADFAIVDESVAG